MTRIMTRKKMMLDQYAHHSFFFRTDHTLLLNEDDIITLHTHFLTNGLHNITIPSQTEGRNILENFFQSAQYYHDIGCLTLDPIPLLNHAISHMYHELLCGGYLDPLCEHDLDQFFLEQFYFDFIWIEMSQQLLESNWFDIFQHKLIQFKIDEHIPIIIFSYL